MVLALLASLAVQAGSGLFANDDIATEGPLAVLVSKATSDRMTAVHHVTQKLLLALIALHICAVLYHWRALRENLVGAMFTGAKRLPADFTDGLSSLRFASPWRALGLFVVAVVVVWLVVSKIAFKP
jgi:cytochrome b